MCDLVSAGQDTTRLMHMGDLRLHVSMLKNTGLNVRFRTHESEDDGIALIG